MTEPDLTFFRALEQQYQETMTRARAGGHILNSAVEELKAFGDGPVRRRGMSRRKPTATVR
ncbi:Hypothetical protein ERS075644_03666 [Mycobacteroides abscessus]|nr:Hypothetical protein ERS075644_03666 [Mycobacteroides abscessus]